MFRGEGQAKHDDLEHACALQRYEHIGVRAHLTGEYRTRSLSGRGRKRASGDGLALEIRPLQPSQPVWDAQVTARGRRMPGTRGTMPWHTPQSSGQQGEPHGKTERRVLGAPFRVEKRTLHKLIGGMHNDLLASNQET